MAAVSRTESEGPRGRSGAPHSRVDADASSMGFGREAQRHETWGRCSRWKVREQRAVAEEGREAERKMECSESEYQGLLTGQYTA